CRFRIGSCDSMQAGPPGAAGPNAMTLTLADLLAPVDRQQFEAEYRGRRPLHIRGHADKFADVMSWDDLSRLLSQSSLWSSKSLELVLDNRKIEASEYCLPGKDRDQRDSML